MKGRRCPGSGRAAREELRAVQNTWTFSLMQLRETPMKVKRHPSTLRDRVGVTTASILR
jgi:hypothetical protein